MSETKSFEELFLAQSVKENLKIKKLKILILSNINSNNLYLFKLKEWQIKQNIKEIANDEAQTGGLLSYLENLCLNVIYIGGNNDTETLFKKPFPSLTVKSVNIHQSF